MSRKDTRHVDQSSSKRNTIRGVIWMRDEATIFLTSISLVCRCFFASLAFFEAELTVTRPAQFADAFRIEAFLRGLRPPEKQTSKRGMAIYTSARDVSQDHIVIFLSISGRATRTTFPRPRPPRSAERNDCSHRYKTLPLRERGCCARGASARAEP